MPGNDAELTRAVEGHDTAEIQRIVARIELEKLQDDLDIRRRIAARRSGTRSDAVYPTHGRGSKESH